MHGSNWDCEGPEVGRYFSLVGFGCKVGERMGKFELVEIFETVFEESFVAMEAGNRFPG